MRSKGVLLLLIFGLAVSIGISIPQATSSTDTTVNSAFAQDSGAAACDALVTQALEIVADTCIGLGRNEVCYGNDFVAATLLTDEFFERPGDIVSVESIADLSTGSIDPDNDTWGVALMDVQADLPNSTDGVRIILFGGAQLEPQAPEVDSLPTCTFTNTSPTNLSLRAAPNSTARAYDVLGFNQRLDVYGQTSSGDWLRSSRGWVRADKGELSCGGVTLATMDGNDDAFVAPMQNFTLQVDDQAQCEAVPTGLLIQTPSGQTANLRINNVELRVGSTASFTVETDGSGCQRFSNYEGNVAIVDGSIDRGSSRIPNGASYTIGAGCVPADESPIQPIEADDRVFVSDVSNDYAAQGTFFEEASSPPYVPTAPSIEAEVSDEEVFLGQCTFVAYTASDTNGVLLDGVPEADAATIQLCPTEDTTYELVAETIDPAFDDAVFTFDVTVIVPEGDIEEFAPTFAVTAEPLQVAAGDCALIAWDSTNVQAVTLDNEFFLEVDSVEVCPTETTTYEVTALPIFDIFNVITELVTIEVLQLNTPTPTPTNTVGPTFTPFPTVTPTNTPICPVPDVFGDPCNPDEDIDGVLDVDDNCPFDPNPMQTNADGDTLGDACDPDFGDLLSVSVTLSNIAPTAGTLVNGTVTVTNVGLVAATNVTVSITESFTACGGGVGSTPSSPVIASLGAGASQAFNFSSDAGVNCNYTLSATATPDASQPETVLGNNTSSASYATVGNDLSATITVSNPAPTIGTSVTFNITVTNSGPGTATGVGYNVTGAFNLCAGGTANPAGPSAGGLTIGAGGSVTDSWTVDTAVNCSGTATVNVTSPATPPDPDFGDRTASAGFTAVTVDLATGAGVSNGSPSNGDVITATLTITNTSGTITATGVTYTIVVRGLATDGANSQCATTNAPDLVINGGPVTLGPGGVESVPVNIDTATFCDGVASIAITGIASPPIEGGPSANSSQTSFRSTFP